MSVFQPFLCVPEHGSGTMAFLLWAGCLWILHLRFVRKERVRSERRLNIACLACIFGLALILSRRLLFSVALCTWLCVSLRRVSMEKFRHLRMQFHAYDIVLLWQGRSTSLFFFRNLRSLATRMLLQLFVSLAALGIILALDRSMVSFTSACLVLGTATAFAIHAWHRAPAPLFVGQQGGSGVFSLPDFLRSVPEAFHAMHRGGVLSREKADRRMPSLESGGPEAVPASAPNIILILNESTFPPGLHQARPLDPRLASFFRSCDGRTRRLRVETFGGGTWMSAFSLMTGIPVGTYGRFRAHVLRWSKGHIRHSLPATLRTMGYRTAVISPLLGDFVGEEAFYRSLGFDEFMDQKYLSARNDQESDAFYFSKALAWLENHAKSQDKPAFLFLMTMSNHHPHGSSGPFGRGLEPFSDYLLRLDETVRDYAEFKNLLGERFPGKAFLFLHFGDHQPPFVWPRDASPDWMARIMELPLEERAYQTYFAVDSLGFEPKTLHELPDFLEIAYLGTALLSAAGLPLDAVHRLRRELALRHAGRLFFADHDGSLARQLNQRMIEAGLLEPH